MSHILEDSHFQILHSRICDPETSHPCTVWQSGLPGNGPPKWRSSQSRRYFSVEYVFFIASPKIGIRIRIYKKEIKEILCRIEKLLFYWNSDQLLAVIL